MQKKKKRSLPAKKQKQKQPKPYRNGETPNNLCSTKTKNKFTQIIYHAMKHKNTRKNKNLKSIK